MLRPQVASVRSEMSKLHATLEEERQLATQHQLALQAQISEAQARAKVSHAIHTQAHTVPYRANNGWPPVV